MQKNRLGCLTGTGITAALITAIIITTYALTSGNQMFSPGLLNAKSGETLGGVTSHAEIAGNCKDCHAAPWESATMADRCEACHAEIASEIQNVASMHGKLIHDNPSLSCRNCHTEHHGANAQLTIIDGALFPHETVGFSLAGHKRTSAGLSFTCDDCHHGDITTFASDSCQTCHSQIDLAFTQAHLLAFGTNCLACHDGVDRYGDDFNHNRYNFKLTGKHTAVVCTECHANAPRNIADLQSLPQDCKSCHQKNEPHQGKFGTDCAACHSTDAWKPAKFDHNLADFKLVDSHVNVKCEQCHINNVFKGTPTDCYSCHKKDDHHNGQFGTDCSACHQPTKWDDATFDHNKSKFPLTGAHANVACQKCHTTGVFKGLSTDCASCHGDPGWHQGAFGLNCAACHNTNTWSNGKFSGKHPSFGEEGGIHHGGATCKTCHTVNVFAATCTACHKNGNPGDGGGGGGNGGGGGD
jgi:hypothetical protein